MSGGELVYMRWEREENERKIIRFIRKNKDIPKEVVDELVKIIYLMRIYDTYMERADYLLAFDDGYESFLTRLKEELSKVVNTDDIIDKINDGSYDVGLDED